MATVPRCTLCGQHSTPINSLVRVYLGQYGDGVDRWGGPQCLDLAACERRRATSADS